MASAEHVHFGSLWDRVDELPRGRPLLLYCRTGNRSAIGASLLEAQGFRDVRSVNGGLDERNARGLRVVTG